jgi:hypothetical protein
VLLLRANPIPGLIVLLASSTLGLGGRVQANFALERPTRWPDQANCPLGFELVLVLRGEEPDEAPRVCSTGGMSAETSLEPIADLPQRPLLARRLNPADGNLRTGDSGPAPPTGPGWGPGMCLLLPPSAPALAGPRSTRLFLAAQQFRPPPFASRLFRPPR